MKNIFYHASNKNWMNFYPFQIITVVMERCVILPPIERMHFFIYVI